MPSLGLSLGLGGVRVLGAAGPIYDPDAAAWFEAVEASGATFGPNTTIANANKAAWSDWVIAQKNAESPIAGRSNWDQLTEPGEGYIQPLMGVNTFDIPAMFGDSDFINFVVGDYDPATGLRGGEDRVIDSGREWSHTPLNDVSVSVILTGQPTTDTPSAGRVVGSQATTFQDGFLSDGRVRSREAGVEDTISLRGEISTPRTLVVNRNAGTGFQAFNGTVFNFSDSSLSLVSEPVTFLNSRNFTRPSDARIGLAAYGRSINVEAMNTACVALSEAIVWP